MKLHELFEQLDQDAVFEHFNTLYPECLKADEQLKITFAQIRSLTAFKNPLDVKLVVKHNYDLQIDQVDVVGTNGESEFALEFQNWQEWLGMGICEDTLKSYEAEVIAAHCFFLMTFLGTNQQQIYILQQLFEGNISQMSAEFPEQVAKMKFAASEIFDQIRCENETGLPM